MVARILRLHLILVLLLISQLGAFAQGEDIQVRMLVSSSVFVSGDLVNLQILGLNDKNELVDGGVLVNLYLVAYDGITKAIERFDTQEIREGMSFYLPSELNTGNYKLIAHIPGSSFQNEALIHVYSPKIFTSSIVPDQADPDLGLNQMGESLTSTGPLKLDVQPSQGAQILKVNADGNSGVFSFKIFDPNLEAFPVVGTSEPSTLGNKNAFEIKWDEISQAMNSRFSIYFLDQALVEEYYWEDSIKMQESLVQHRGTSKVWAYQFGPMGDRLGEVQINTGEWVFPRFTPFENTVPFDESLRSILDHKRSRKYIDQIYRSDVDQVKPAYSGELKPADQTYFGKDYEGLATLREALSSIVNKVSVKRSKQEYSITLSPASSGFRYEQGPLILFNGVPVHELDSLIETPFHEIESISVYNSIATLKQFGTLGRFGVLSVQLKQEYSNPLESKLDELLTFHGINELVSAFEQVDQEAPDLRAVLSWSSGILIQNNEPVQRAWNYSDVNDSYVIWGALQKEKAEPIQWVQPLPTN